MGPCVLIVLVDVYIILQMVTRSLRIALHKNKHRMLKQYYEIEEKNDNKHVNMLISVM